MKNILSLILTLILLFSSFPSAAAIDYDEEGAYQECCTLYPDFINNIKAAGATDAQLAVFVKSVEEQFLKLDAELNEENFDSLMYKAFKAAFKLRKNIKVRDALAKAYPESVTAAMDLVITEEFMPIYNTVKRFLLGITTPVVTLSGNSTALRVHYVSMPEDAIIIVGLYLEDGTLLHANIKPTGALSCNCSDIVLAAYLLALAYDIFNCCINSGFHTFSYNHRISTGSNILDTLVD